MSSKKTKGWTRRQFVESSSRAGVTVAGAALIPRLETRDVKIVGSRLEVAGARGAVAAEPEEAARAGARMLELGGNAADAAAAAALVCCIVRSQSVDLGGYVAAAVVLDARSGRVFSLDANSVAPAAANERMYPVLPPGAGTPSGINETEYACRVKDDANVFGPLAVGPPGTLAGIATLWERWGSVKWAQLLEPARELVERGFQYGLTAGALKTMEAPIRRFEASVRHYFVEGRLPRADETWHRPDMEKTLRRLDSAGWHDFYSGELGRKIADHVSGAGGILTRKDMAEYAPRVTEPYEITYRAAKVYGPVLPNGCLSSLQILRMLDCLEPLRDDGTDHWHTMTEVLKLAWRDRLQYFGDPAFTSFPVERYLSREYAAGRVETLRQFPQHVDKLEPRFPLAAAPGTQHISTADGRGNVVAITISHGGLFGSCVTVPGTGITLGHGMCRFDPHPGLPNSVAAGKRPLNNVAPMVLRAPGRDIALGVRGGRFIVSISAQLAARFIDADATVAAAVSAPRIHAQGREPLQATEDLPAPIRAELARLGHDVQLFASPAAATQCAEYAHREKKARAAADGFAAGLA